MVEYSDINSEYNNQGCIENGHSLAEFLNTIIKRIRIYF